MLTPPRSSLLCRDRALDYGRRTLIMGVLNVTPDSFSDGGRYSDVGSAISRGREMVAAGADIVDVGGESSRPGAAGVSEAEELGRVLPVIEGLAAFDDVMLSVDTVRSGVARRCLDAGARLVNDIGGLRDPAMVDVVAEYGCGIVIMHMAGTPETMQRHPAYGDVVGDVVRVLEERVSTALSRGVASGSIMIDPGVGFGKTLAHNLELLRHLDRFVALGYPVLVGTSRKSFLGRILDDAPVDCRLEGTAASVAVAIAHGANAVRVHDVGFMSRVARVADAIRYGYPDSK